MRRDLNLAVLSHLPGPYAVSGGFRQADAQIDGDVEIASAVDDPAEVRSNLDMLASKVSGVTSTAYGLTASADDFSASLSLDNGVLSFVAGNDAIVASGLTGASSGSPAIPPSSRPCRGCRRAPRMVGYLSLPRLVDPFTPRLDPSAGRNLKLLGPATYAAAPNGACARARLSLPVGAK